VIANLGVEIKIETLRCSYWDTIVPKFKRPIELQPSRVAGHRLGADHNARVTERGRPRRTGLILASGQTDANDGSEAGN
jgi:hypothetical protein